MARSFSYTILTASQIVISIMNPRRNSWIFLFYMLRNYLIYASAA